MTRDDIEAEFDKFFEFGTEDRNAVTSVSARLFAEHCIAIAIKEERNRWVRALDEEMVCSHLGIFNDGDDPKSVINKLIAWNQDVALDPAVSSGARKLIQQERESCAMVCDAERKRAEEWSTGMAVLSADRCAQAIRARGSE